MGLSGVLGLRTADVGTGGRGFPRAGSLSLPTRVRAERAVLGTASLFPPTSKSLSALSEPFRDNAERFIAAMEHAGINVDIKSTYRPIQWAYLAHYSWLIKKGKMSPIKVPAFSPTGDQEPVDICWVHTSADGALDVTTSRAAAAALVKALKVDPTLTTAPAFPSRHNLGDAIDMTTTWDKGTITILNDQGKEVEISAWPHNGLNRQLMAVGLTYHLHHFCYDAHPACMTKTPASDRNHWSDNGH